MEPAVVRPAPPLSALLDGPPRPRPVLVRPEQVGGTPAWRDLVHAGALRVVRDDAAVPARVPLTPDVRAAALAARVPAHAVLAGRTAAWVHTGVPRPRSGDPVELAFGSGRHRPEVWAGVRVWQGPGLVADSVLLGGVRVTTPVRTVVDVALREPPAQAVAIVLALARAGADLDAAGRQLERRVRVVGRPRARGVLAECRARRGAGP